MADLPDSGKTFDYFICYCGTDLRTGYNVQAFADELYKTLTDCGKRVYYAPEIGHGDAYNSDAALHNLIDNLTTSFIVLLTPGFFDVFDDQSNNDSPIIKEITIALKRAEGLGKSSLTNIKDFMKYVHLSGFTWQRSQKYLMRQLFADYDFNDYFDIGAFTEANATAATETEELQAAVKKFACNYLKIDVDRKKSIGAYSREINLCFHSIITHSKQFFLDELSTDTKKRTRGKLIMPKLFENYKTILGKYGMYTAKPEDTRSTYWPVFFNDTSRFSAHASAAGRCEELRKFELGDFMGEECSISTCAVCFGALQILHWLTVDKAASGSLYDYTNEYFNECLKGALNLIVFMRNKDGSWPGNKIFNSLNSDHYELDSGLNQTTLAVSTLLKSGFLSTSLPADLLERRFEYINESIDWLLRGCKKDHMSAYWGIPVHQECSTLMTAMCLDTFIKYLCEPYVIIKNPESRKNIEDILKKIRWFFKTMQHEDGSIKPTYESEDHSFPHTAKVLSSMCAYYKFTKNDEEKEKAKKIICKCFEYLAGLLIDKNSRLYKEENKLISENYNIPEILDYEMNGELMAVSSIVNFMHDHFETIYGSNVKLPGGKTVSYESIVSSLFDLLNSYREKHVCTYIDITATQSILIKGIRDNEKLQYPIYLMYYYRMAVTELLKLVGGKN